MRKIMIAPSGASTAVYSHGVPAERNFTKAPRHHGELGARGGLPRLVWRDAGRHDADPQRSNAWRCAFLYDRPPCGTDAAGRGE